MFSKSESAMDSRARRAAKRVGLRATKSRWRRGTIDNVGRYRLFNLYTNSVVQGWQFELNAEKVIAICRELE